MVHLVYHLKVLCKKKLKWYEKALLKLGVNIVNTEYDYVYSSRKVIKNPNLNPNAQHYYNEDIWGIAHTKIQEFFKRWYDIFIMK